MSVETILDAISVEADERVAEIEEGARQEAERILEEARVEGERVRLEAMHRASAPAATVVAQQRTKAEQQVRRELADVLEDLERRLAQSARRRIDEIVAEEPDRWTEILLALVHEAAGAIDATEADGRSVVVSVHPDEEKACRRKLEEKGFKVEVYAETQEGRGVVLATDDGRVAVRNTVPVRLSEASAWIRWRLFRLMGREPEEGSAR